MGSEEELIQATFADTLRLNEAKIQQQTEQVSIPIVSVEEFLLPEDRVFLYTAFECAANELRRIRRERKKNQQIG